MREGGGEWGRAYPGNVCEGGYVCSVKEMVVDKGVFDKEMVPKTEGSLWGGEYAL